MKTTILTLSLAASAVAIVACVHEGPRTSTTTTTSAPAPVVENQVAIDEITRERCDRAQACNEIGGDRDYRSMAACTREIGHDTRASLRAEECPRRISRTNLHECLSEIRSEGCGNPLAKIDRLASCSKVNLCAMGH